MRMAHSTPTQGLNRFVTAQEPVYADVLSELRRGQKKSHWMWFIFPQAEGLGHSAMSRRYAIKDAAEAHEYLSHPILGRRLLECAEAIWVIQGRSASQIFGHPDDLKLKSSLALFASVEGEVTIFKDLLKKYFLNEQSDCSRCLDAIPN